MAYIPVSDRDAIELGTIYRSWYVFRGAGFAVDLAKKLANTIVNIVNGVPSFTNPFGRADGTIRVVKVVWYGPDQIDNNEQGFPIPAEAFSGPIKPWAIRVDWKKIAEGVDAGPNQAVAIGDVRALIIAAFFVIAGLLIVLKFTEKSVTNVAQKTFPWAIAGLAGIALIVMRRRFAT